MNKMVTKDRWFPRDEIQVLPATDDLKSAALLAGRRQSGAQKKVYPRKKAPPVKPRKRPARVSAEAGLKRRRQT